ncbi:protein TITANIA [Dioscorea cayenensis subsp. rotundata]|uniref:Protein TITANIA n=1 Tax=Dioscorea cayennensis subsp. rotundata TaxID=55577 RepID=A0AB40CZ83_DIOCR|nr:protein TITANIA [Dioscorea cayenensis subsp. rotundata]
MFLDPDSMMDLSRHQSIPKSPDRETPAQKVDVFDGMSSKILKPGNSELTLSYLCENPKEKEQMGSDFLISVEKSRSKGKEIVPDLPQPGDEPKWVERDFLQLNGMGSKTPAKREIDDGVDGDGREKKGKIESLNLSLSLNSSNPSANNANTSNLNPLPPKKSYSNNTWTTNSDDFGLSMSYSQSVPFSHNPSCSLTRNSTENYDNSHIWYCGGEGTNGSVHSKFRPVNDGNTITFSNNNSLYRANSSENHSLFPSELPAKNVKSNVVVTLDNGRNGSVKNGNVMVTRPSMMLLEIATEPVPIMAQMLQEIASESLEAVKECLRSMMDAAEKKDEFASLQRRLERRSDLTLETLSKSHKVQLEVLVAIKTGSVEFLSLKKQISTEQLVEIFLLVRCRNLNCQNALPVDDCDCKICSTQKGFCSACMCPICLKFDCASNTCSWVGCDVCSHWCHAVCGIQKNLIRPGTSLNAAGGTMHFHCLGCGHASDMFGFVKEVFNCCAKDWDLDTLIKELDCVRKIFHGSADLEGKELHGKAEEMLTSLSKKRISPLDACNSILQFFKYGVADLSVSGSSHKSILTAQPVQCNEPLPLTPLAASIPQKPTFNLKPANFVIDTTIDPCKPDIKPPLHDQHFGQPKEAEGFQSIESIIRFKEAEAKLFQRLADDAKREVENYRQIIRAKTLKLEEEYASKLAKLCLQETEERRRKKLEEFKFLENSNCDFHNMKRRMQAEIAGLLERMEATKKQWV